MLFLSYAQHLYIEESGPILLQNDLHYEFLYFLLTISVLILICSPYPPPFFLTFSIQGRGLSFPTLECDQALTIPNVTSDARSQNSGQLLLTLNSSWEACSWNSASRLRSKTTWRCSGQLRSKLKFQVTAIFNCQIPK